MAAVVWGIVAVYLKNRKRKQLTRDDAYNAIYGDPRLKTQDELAPADRDELVRRAFDSP